LRQHCDGLVRLDWQVANYRRYLHLGTDWAAQLDLAPADVEYLMFSDAASQEPGSQWVALRS
jgi:hypothetical protein